MLDPTQIRTTSPALPPGDPAPLHHLLTDAELRSLMDQVRADERANTTLVAAHVFGAYLQLVEPIHRRCATLVMDTAAEQGCHNLAVAAANKSLSALRVHFGLHDLDDPEGQTSSEDVPQDGLQDAHVDAPAADATVPRLRLVPTPALE